MELVQSRLVTDDVQRLAAFYARLVEAAVVLNDYYVEVPTGAMSVGFSRRHFTEYREDQAACPGCPQHRAQAILDFQADDVDAEYARIAGICTRLVSRVGARVPMTIGAAATVLALIVTLAAIRVRREDVPDSPLSA
jgi:hypothetical protein